MARSVDTMGIELHLLKVNVRVNFNFLICVFFYLRVVSIGCCDTGIRMKSCMLAGHICNAHLHSVRVLYCWLLKRTTWTF
jgi:hypothetical protein